MFRMVRCAALTGRWDTGQMYAHAEARLETSVACYSARRRWMGLGGRLPPLRLDLEDGLLFSMRRAL